jgi:hypothetical protein
MTKLVDIDADLVHETANAYCVKIDDDTFEKEAKRYWLPKSVTENNGDGTFTLPEYIATEKGLV